MTTGYEKIRVTKRVGHGVLVEVETSMDYIRCTLTANEARLLAQDLFDATLGVGVAAAPVAEPSGSASKTEIADAHTLRRDIQQIARSLQNVAERLKRLEEKPPVTSIDLYAKYLADMKSAGALRTSYATRTTP